jgi:C4-dicarboxylate-specific signal transduction histidine kinase
MSMLVDINRIVSVSTSIISSQIKSHTARFQLDLSDDPPKVRGNSQQLEQVVINLVMNALQSLTDREKQVRVETSLDEEKGDAIIRVIDEGQGMPAEVKGRLFEPFFSTKLESGGTGLGLAISNVIVKDHGGTMSFESVPGKGTVAIVRIPVVTEMADGQTN